MIEQKDSELNHARREAQQSNAELEHALEHLNQAVEGRIVQISDLRHRGNKRREVAQGFIDRSVKEAQDLLDEKATLLEDTLRGTLSSSRNQADRFLEDIHQSVDRFSQDIRTSLQGTLEVFEERRAAAWVSVFFMGCLFGSFIFRRSHRPLSQELAPSEFKANLDRKAA